MTQNFKVQFVFVITLSLVSCVDFVKGVAEGVSSAQSESISASNFNTIAIDSLYQLDVPSYMKEMPNLNPDASLKYANIYKEAYTIVINENKEEFVSVFKEIGEYDDKKSSLENYMIVQKQVFAEQADDLKVEEYGLSLINGKPARQLKMTGIVEDLDIFYIIVFVEGKDNLYMIMNWTLKDRYKKLENTFEYINGTFKEL